MIVSSCTEACSAHRRPNSKPRCRSASASTILGYPGLTGRGGLYGRAGGLYVLPILEAWGLERSARRTPRQAEIQCLASALCTNAGATASVKFGAIVRWVRKPSELTGRMYAEAECRHRQLYWLPPSARPSRSSSSVTQNSANNDATSCNPRRNISQRSAP